MASDAKTRRLDCGDASVDRISNLPRNLIDIILKCLPLRDAARTSILSKRWRDVWGKFPFLVFDDLFFTKVDTRINRPAKLSEVTRVVSDILLAHSGPILKFHLFLPRDLPPHERQVTLWIKNISNNGVRDLKIYNRGRIPSKVPSYLFSCLELTHLTLINCVLNPPPGFKGFCNMISVELEDVVITADMSFGTKLDKLDMKCCIGIGHLHSQFNYNNNLTMLFIDDCREIDCQWFECTQKVETLGLILGRVAKKTINLEKLVYKMPRIHTLDLDGFFLKSLEPGAAIMETLELYLYDIEFYDLAQIRNVLCLIKASPNLRYLCITLEPNEKTGDDLMAASVIKYLHLPNLIDMNFNQLENVDIYGLPGLTELQFIKLLLASSPSLRRMKLFDSGISDSEEAFRISRELMRFPRASRVAEIIWICRR